MFITDEQLREVPGKVDQIRLVRIGHSWEKRLLREFSIVIARIRSTGYRVQTCADVQADTGHVFDKISRVSRKQRKKIAAAKPTNNLEFEIQDHHGRLLYSLEREMKKTKMNLLPSTRVNDAPLPSPPMIEGEQ